MKCTLPGSNVKVFARAMHSLSKIGDELYVEPSPEGISFRTVNSSRSAFASFNFKPLFFSFFEVPSKSQSPDDDAVRCKVAMKACINAFRSIASIEKSVDKCKLSIHPEQDKLIINLICKHGINKTYNLSFIECETLEALFDKNNCSCSITSQSRLLCDSVVNFHSNQEVTLSVSSQKAIIKSFVDDDPDPSTAVHTELTLEAGEFDRYSIAGHCDVTFCLKEVRALLSFSEPMVLPVTLSFSKPGNPLILSIDDQTRLFDVDFVLATLANQASSQVSSHYSLSSAKKAQSVKKKGPIKRPSEFIDNEENASVQRRLHRNASENISDMDSNIIDKVSHISDQSRPGLGGKSLSSPLPAHANGGEFRQKSKALRLSEICNGNEHHGQPMDVEPPAVIPGTPPSKAQNYFFKRCFESTFCSQQISGHNVILAEDSDPEG